MDIINTYINALTEPIVLVTGALFALFFIFKNDSIYQKVKGNFTPVKEGSKPKKNTESSIEDMLNELWKTNQDEIQYYKTMDKKLPLNLRIKNNLRDLYVNPYNDKSLGLLIINMGIGAIIAILISLFGMTNILFSLPLIPAIALIPYIYLQAKIAKNRVTVQENNLMLFTSFTSTYAESSDISTAFKKTAALYSPDTREYKALTNATDLLSSLSLHNVLQKLKIDLLADESICMCIDTIESCEYGTKLYKRTFEYTLTKYEQLVRVNKESQMAATILVHAYTVMLFAIIGFLIYYRYFNEDIIDSLYNQFAGQATIFVFFISYAISGTFIQKLCTPIKYQDDEYVKVGEN